MLNSNFKINQLLNWDSLNNHYGDERYSIDVDKTNHTITINSTGIASGGPTVILTPVIPQGHKVAIVGISNLSGTGHALYDGASPTVSADTIRTQTLSNHILLRIEMGRATEDCVISPMIIDLTDSFGAGNEPASIAEVKRWITETYIPFNTGETGKLQVV